VSVTGIKESCEPKICLLSESTFCTLPLSVLQYDIYEVSELRVGGGGYAVAQLVEVAGSIPNRVTGIFH
jgi:hypothetical protein